MPSDRYGGIICIINNMAGGMVYSQRYNDTTGASIFGPEWHQT